MWNSDRQQAVKVGMREILRTTQGVALWAALAACGCVIEKIDAIIAEHGVTYWPSSTGDGDGSTGGTSTSTSTSTGVESSAEAGGSQAASTTTVVGEGTAGTGSSSTGVIEPICGNGMVEEGEICDDANDDPDDGCKDCVGDSIVFISSEVYQGFKLGGLYGADQRCRSLAAKAGLLRPETYRAWLSTATTAAGDRLSHSGGRYTLVNGLVVAQDWASLTSGSLLNTITADEGSQYQDTRVWTGTLADGQPAVGSEFCENWGDNYSGFLVYGGAGRSLAADAGWSFFADSGCGAEYRLYCFENRAWASE